MVCMGKKKHFEIFIDGNGIEKHPFESRLIKLPFGPFKSGV